LADEGAAPRVSPADDGAPTDGDEDQGEADERPDLFGDDTGPTGDDTHPTGDDTGPTGDDTRPTGRSLLVASLRLYARVPRLLVVSAFQGCAVVALFALAWHPGNGARLRRLLEGSATAAGTALLAVETLLVVLVGLVVVAFANGVVVRCVADALDGERPGLLAGVRAVRDRWRSVALLALVGTPLGSLLWYAVSFVYAVLVRPMSYVLGPGGLFGRAAAGVARRAKATVVVAAVSWVLGTLAPDAGGGGAARRVRAERRERSLLALPAIVVDGEDLDAAGRRSARLLEGLSSDEPAPDLSLRFTFVWGWVLLVVPGASVLTPVLTWLGYAPTDTFSQGLGHGLYTSVFVALASALVALARLGFYRYATTGTAPCPVHEVSYLRAASGAEADDEDGRHEAQAALVEES
jgi:hypothetical protein